MLPAVGIGLVTMAIGMVLGFAALRRATRASTYVWRLAASFGACVPAGFLLIVFFGTLSWVFATARSGDPLWLWRGRSRRRYVRGSQRSGHRGHRGHRGRRPR